MCSIRIFKATFPGGKSEIAFLLGFQRSFEPATTQNVRLLQHVRRKEDLVEITDFPVLTALDGRRPVWFSFVESFFIACRMFWPNAYDCLALQREQAYGSSTRAHVARIWRRPSFAAQRLRAGGLPPAARPS